MAMYETQGGFCPSNSFSFFMDSRKGNVLSKRTFEILGDRRGYMVYDQAFTAKEPYIVDMFLHGETTLGLEIAVILREYIPVCIYAEQGRKILIHDVINTSQIPSEAIKYEDHRYVVGLLNGEEVSMYLYKK